MPPNCWATPGRTRTISAAHQNPGCAGQALAAGPSAGGRAAELGGEPKTEMWYIAEAAPDAELYVGLKRGVTPRRVRAKNRGRHGGRMFSPRARAGGRRHVSAQRPRSRPRRGLVIFEIQQNSDTTYRVFDWNRLGLDGKPRELHVPQSLASIDFNDFEPALLPRAFTRDGVHKVRPLVSDPLFTAEAQEAGAGAICRFQPKQAANHRPGGWPGAGMAAVAVALGGGPVLPRSGEPGAGHVAGRELRRLSFALRCEEVSPKLGDQHPGSAGGRLYGPGHPLQG